jgi:hypothetical protein
MSRKKRESRGYTPALIEELDMPISGAALQLLLRIRRDSDMRETDGVLTKRQVDALAVGHDMRPAAKHRALGELVLANLLHEIGGVFTDSHFDQWCRTSAERKELRDKWNAAKAKPTSGSTVESTVESMTDSAHTAAAAPSASPSTSAAAANGLPAIAEANVTAAYPPSQVDRSMIVRTWEACAGRQATQGDADHVGWWLSQYGLTANEIAGVLTRVHARETAKGNVIGRLDYFDGAIRDASDAAKPRRGSVVVHDMERLIIRGFDASGNPEPPMPAELAP